MNREEIARPEDSPALGPPAPIRSTDVDVGSAARDIPSPLVHIDARAVSALSIKALARYQQTKKSCSLARGDEAAILATFVPGARTARAPRPAT